MTFLRLIWSSVEACKTFCQNVHKLVPANSEKFPRQNLYPDYYYANSAPIPETQFLETYFYFLLQMFTVLHDLSSFSVLLIFLLLKFWRIQRKLILTNFPDVPRFNMSVLREMIDIIEDFLAIQSPKSLKFKISTLSYCFSKLLCSINCSLLVVATGQCAQ